MLLFQVFYRPMLKFNVMSKQYINQLFPNLDELIKIHGELVYTFGWFTGILICLISNYFVRQASMMSLTKIPCMVDFPFVKPPFL